MEYKKVRVVIPQHPWEEGTQTSLWYLLKWNDNEQIQTMYIDSLTREVIVDIPRSHTVYICAYPLGEMQPFGCGITPRNLKGKIELNQCEGYVAHLLINSNLGAAQHVNFDLVMDQLSEQTNDVRTLDDATFIADVQNGRLNKNTLRTKPRFEVESISIPNGKWMSEYQGDLPLFVNKGKTGTLFVSPGVYRYYCTELDREFRLAVDYDGTVFYSLRYGMTGL